MLYNLDFAYFRSFPGGSDGKESACNAGELYLIHGKIPWRKATPSCIFAWKNPMDRGTWKATVYEVTKGRTQMSNSYTQNEIHLFFSSH